jgi:hypothetical protein
MIIANFKERENALKRHIRGLQQNLLKEYICDHLTLADDREIEKFTVMLRAQSAVPARAFAEVDQVSVKRMAAFEESVPDDEPEEEDEEYLNDGECSI